MPRSLSIRLPLLLAAGAALCESPLGSPPQGPKVPETRGWAAAQPGANSASTATPAAIPAERIQLMRPTAAIEIQAEPAKVWKRLLSAEGMAAFGMQGEGRMKSLAKVGDNARTSMSGDKGSLIVTYAKTGEEWRAAWEPDSGHYVCAVRYRLQPQGKATLLTYGDWYSEEKPSGADQTLAETKQAMSEGLARFKALVEKASAGP